MNYVFFGINFALSFLTLAFGLFMIGMLMTPEFFDPGKFGYSLTIGGVVSIFSAGALFLEYRGTIRKRFLCMRILGFFLVLLSVLALLALVINAMAAFFSHYRLDVQSLVVGTVFYGALCAYFLAAGIYRLWLSEKLGLAQWRIEMSELIELPEAKLDYRK
ncbi:MAG: hypothetical protein PVH19_08405 [Planctomycetia bacterium]